MKKLTVFFMIASLLFTGLSFADPPATTTGETEADNLPTVDDSIDVEAEKPKSVKEWINKQPRKKKGALKGALGGALAGALGAIALGKSPLAGAAIGAAAGALTGFLIGKRRDRIFKSRDEAVAELQYDPSQGYVIEVQEVTLDPPNLLPGETSQLRIRCAVVGPDPKEKIVVQSYTGLKYDEHYIFAAGPKKIPIRRGGGIVETTMQITMPEDAPAGSYVVEAQFEELQGRFEQAETGPLYVTEPEPSEAAAS